MKNNISKQEEIREGIAKQSHINGCIWAKIYGTDDPHNCEWEELSEYHRELYLAGADLIMEKEDSQGVVIKVDRELPQPPHEPLIKLGNSTGWGRFRTGSPEEIWKMALGAIKKAGYVAIKPLIEEITDGR